MSLVKILFIIFLIWILPKLFRLGYTLLIFASQYRKAKKQMEQRQKAYGYGRNHGQNSHSSTSKNTNNTDTISTDYKVISEQDL